MKAKFIVLGILCALAGIMFLNMADTGMYRGARFMGMAIGIVLLIGSAGAAYQAFKRK